MKKLFAASQFTPTQWDTAEDKAQFANRFVHFVEGGFKREDFSKKFYTRLMLTFGHIAHFNQDGFYGTFFTTTRGKVDFLHQTAEWTMGGDPKFTYSDVETVLRDWVRDGALDKAIAAANAEQEQSERAMLRRLQAKYPQG